MYQLAEKVYAVSHNIQGDKIEVSVVSGTIAEVQEYTIHNQFGRTSERWYRLEWWNGYEHEGGKFSEHCIFQVPTQVSERVFDILKKHENSKLKTQ